MKMKRIFLVLVAFILVFTVTACGSKEEDNNDDALAFKEEYESLNGKTNAKGNEYRSVSVSLDNPFIYSTASEIIEKIENKDTFYLYVGSELCPWCRSAIEEAIKVAKEYGIDEIYYIDAWDDEGKEILRDKYVLDEDGNTTLSIEGTKEYFKLLEYFNDLLPDYTYAANKNGGDKLDVNEKRIYFPTYIYVENGVAKKYTDGLSDNQSSSRQELTEEILNDEKEKFEELFTEVCDDAC